jgi:hypothetical protein
MTDDELREIEISVRDWLRAVRRNKEGWQAIHDRAAACPRWLKWLYWDRSPIPPPLPPPLPVKWQRIAAEKGWLTNAARTE